MNRFLLLFSFVLVVVPLQLSAQRLSLTEPAAVLDSIEIVPFRFLPLDDCGFFLVRNDRDFLVLRDSASFTGLIESKRFIGNCKDTEVPQVDFTTHIVVGFNLFFDCNANVVVSVVKDTAGPEYYVYVDIHDGMCRGMTSRSYWLSIPVQDKEAPVQYIERKHAYRAEG